MQVPRSQRHILRSLKLRGPQSVRILSRQLEMTTMGVRHHLADLAKLELVEQQAAEKQHRGRPVSRWALTRKGNDWFPRAGVELAREMLEVVEVCWGGEGVERMVDERFHRIRERYQEAIPRPQRKVPEQDTRQRVELLVNLLGADGYMAEARLLPDGWLLVQNHCPLQACADSYPHFCEAEKRMFCELLGPGVTIEQTDHLLAGDRRCAWRIRQAAEVERAA